MHYDNFNEIVLNYICNAGFPLQLKSNWWRIMMTVLFVGTPWRQRGSCRVVIFFTSKASCRYQCRLLPFHFENLPCVKRTCVNQNWSYFSCLLITNNTAVEASALTLMSRIANSSMDTSLNKHLKDCLLALGLNFNIACDEEFRQWRSRNVLLIIIIITLSGIVAHFAG